MISARECGSAQDSHRKFPPFGIVRQRLTAVALRTVGSCAVGIKSESSTFCEQLLPYSKGAGKDEAIGAETRPDPEAGPSGRQRSISSLSPTRCTLIVRLWLAGVGRRVKKAARPCGTVRAIRRCCSGCPRPMSHRSHQIGRLAGMRLAQPLRFRMNRRAVNA
ncbi:hypothetical protein Bphy_7547 (plasmid) [Paraburkholderia phymatum STM815]|uniref:Uncharacterized protein n=1 Tax=Paraburkholderia phymatum (strain DSM 17167 / CIP 108236 / LMG 21445 / STM815) TaxID=391038 RepID=B2JXX4_PARP8|nr:hypothetical protein Bphy_7547 [Paraburkholderia phymatum STM815]